MSHDTECDKCETTGYKHLIDMQAQHYDVLYPDTMPIYTSIYDNSGFLCRDCADRMAAREGATEVRIYLQGKTRW